YANTGIFASSYSRYSPHSPLYSGFNHLSFWGSSNYYSGDYYNYYGPWENGYTSGGAVTVTPTPSTPKPPHRHDRHDREVCPPPDALHPRPSPTFASTDSPRALS